MLGFTVVGVLFHKLPVGGNESVCTVQIGSDCQPKPKMQLMKIIKSFFAKIRQQLLARRVHREIEHYIFPQLCGKKNRGYPFLDSEEKLEKLATFGALDVQLHLDIIERRAKELPDTYRQAFRFIAYRDLNKRLKMYEEFVRERIPRKTALVAARPQPVT